MLKVDTARLADLTLLFLLTGEAGGMDRDGDLECLPWSGSSAADPGPGDESGE